MNRRQINKSKAALALGDRDQEKKYTEQLGKLMSLHIFKYDEEINIGRQGRDTTSQKIRRKLWITLTERQD